MDKDNPSESLYRLDLPLLDAAAVIAWGDGLPFVAPEQLLIAVIRQADSASALFLQRHEISEEWVAATVSHHYGIPRPRAESRPVTLAHRTILALAGAVRAALHDPRPPAAYEPRHLLAALLQDEVAGGGVIGMLLLQRGLTPESARESLTQLNH